MTSNGRIATLAFIGLALLLLSCNPLKTQAAQRLPGVAAVTGPVPPVFISSILGIRVPQAVAVTADGSRLYVAEGDGDRGVKVIDLLTGTVTGTLAPPKTTPGDRKPQSVAIGRGQIVYVVDRLRMVVDLYDSTGQWLGTLPDPPVRRGLWEPLGVSVSVGGDIYVTNGNPEGPFVATYDSEGRFLTTYGVPAGGAGSLSFPAGMALGRGAETYMFVADSNNARIAVINADGQVEQTYGNEAGPGALGLPRGIFVDQRGYCYVTDATGHIVKVWDTKTEPATFLFSFGQTGFNDGEFLYPNSIAADERGRLYIADTGNDRVQTWGY